MPTGVAGRDFSSWIRQVDCLRCSRCNDMQPLRCLDNFCSAKCTGVASVVTAAKRRRTDARQDGSRFQACEHPETTLTNKWRVEAGLPVLAQTAKIDMLRESLYQTHCAEAAPGRHRAVFLDVHPDVKMDQARFSAWSRAVRCIQCKACTKFCTLRSFEDFLLEDCVGSPEAFAEFTHQQHIRSGAAGRAARAKAEAKPKPKPCAKKRSSSTTTTPAKRRRS